MIDKTIHKNISLVIGSIKYYGNKRPGISPSVFKQQSDLCELGRGQR